MNRLFATLNLDEDVDVLIARIVEARGFAVLTTVDAGNLGVDDEDQLDFAIAQERCLVTHNRIDFEAIAENYFRSKRDHFGIVIAVRRSPHEIAQRLFKLLDAMTADEFRNQLVYI